MKFAEHLSAHITPEWRKQYISYEVRLQCILILLYYINIFLPYLVHKQFGFCFQEMKAMLYTAIEEAPSAESVEPEIITRHFASFDEMFITFCDMELKKINTFYSGILF